MGQDLSKIICITGATGGLGSALALTLAATDVHFILLGRRKRLLEKLDDLIQKKGASATLVPVDFRDSQMLDQLAAPVLERFGRVDALFSCAAVLGPLTLTPQMDPKEWHKVIEVNLTTNWRLIRTFSPLLQRAEKSQAVFMTCKALLGAYDAAYAASKKGLEGLVESYAKEMEQTAVEVHLMDPGPMATVLWQKAFPGLAPDFAPLPEISAEKIVHYLAGNPKSSGKIISVQRDLSLAPENQNIASNCN